ncbi:MAG TPA: dihydrolipoyllysine-residue succinyltransferase [Xanthomonadales bacterium]|nr:dihydrolipoyllysine-residue succinyltransferase [Xanthomonadales bacterium]
MSKEVKVPVLPESVEDAVVAAWHKKPGESVRRDENLVDLETDKVVLEVPSPIDGTLGELQAQEGETVTSGQVLVSLEEGMVEEPESDSDETDEKVGSEETPKPDDSAKQSSDTRATETKTEAAKDKGTEKSSLSPSARRLAEEEDVDPGKVPGTGRGGRVTKGDVLQFLKGAGSRTEERVKMTRLRSRISARLKEAQNTAAILTSFNEVDLKAVMELRKRHQEEFTAKHGVKLGFMSFFVKACCDALRKYPIVNASVEGDEIIYHGYQDIGIAVSTERGLMVPILRNAENMSLAEIELAIRHFAGLARDGKIALEDLQGGTFTITNGGVFGSLISTPLINPPQSAILGMHNIKERPVVVDGEIVARPMMYTAISYDHRIIDGREAVLFLVALKDALEDPSRLLLGL